MGYNLPNFDIPQYAKHCPRIIDLKPWQIHKRQRWQKDHPDNFFDVSSQRYRCRRCTQAAVPIGNRVKRLRELEAKESGQRKLSMVKITNGEQLNTLFRKHRDNPDLYREGGPELDIRGLYPLASRVPEWAQEKGRQTYAEICKTGKKWREMTKGCMLRRWEGRCDQPICFHDPHPGVKCSHCSCLKYHATELPCDVRFGVCVLCWNKDGRALIIRRIPLTSNSDFTRLVTVSGGQVPTKVGTLFGENSTRKMRAYRHINLADAPEKKILDFIGLGFGNTRERSYGEIARGHGCGDSSFVQKRVEFMIRHLPESNLVDARYRPMIELAKLLTQTSK